MIGFAYWKELYDSFALLEGLFSQDDNLGVLAQHRIIAEATPTFHTNKRQKAKKIQHGKNCVSPKHKQVKHSLEIFYLTMGLQYFKRNYESFLHTVQKISPHMQVNSAEACVNCAITNSTHVAFLCNTLQSVLHLT